MITDVQIQAVQHQIADYFFQQVENGLQTTQLNNPALRSCGQLLQELSRPQRGLHGTAAALYTLAKENKPVYNKAIEGSIKYLERRKAAERGNSISAQDIERDSSNIIKIGEILHALSAVNSGQASKDKYSRQLLTQLANSKVNNNGWGFFTDLQYTAPELLPTIFALKGKLSVNDSDPDAITFVLNECKTKVSNGIKDFYTYAIVILGVYVITFFDTSNFNEKALKELTKQLASSELCLLQSHNEVNIEYWHEMKHEYVRIPWQLYLISLLARFDTWNYSKNIVQERVSEILNDSNATGFKYPYSGSHLSSRTSAIVYEVLDKIKGSLKPSAVYLFYNGIDKIRLFFSQRWIKVILVISVLLTLVYSLYSWWMSKNDPNYKSSIFSDLGPEVLITIAYSLLHWGRSRK